MSTPLPPRLRLRPDLIFVRPAESSDGRYAIKDPISLEYFQVGEREAFLLEQMRQPKSLVELQELFHKRFAPDEISPEELLTFCSTMHNASLLMPEGRGQAPVLSRLARERTPSVWSNIANPLGIRIPGFDPTWLLDKFSPLGRLIFSRAGFATIVLGTIAAILALAGHAEELSRDLTELTNLFQPQYALAAIVAVALVKTWHELGHGVACRTMGGECHEMGVLLLVGIPCLYCDVSDSWIFSSRTKRAIVALGGVYFELLLAILATAAWLLLAPGFLQILALYILVVSTISTWGINLNPFLRYDGYYLLADLWSVSNLYEQSRAALWRPLRRWVIGDQRTVEQFDASRGSLAAYAAASILMSSVLLACMLWGVYHILARNALRPVGDILIALVAVGLVYRWGAKAVSLVGNHPLQRLGRLIRLTAVTTFAAIAVWGATQITIEQSLRSPCRLECSQLAHVTTPHTGELIEHVPYDSQVAAGDVLAVLCDPERELKLQKIRGEASELKVRRTGLLTMSQKDPTLFSEIAILESQLGELARRYRTLKAELAQLTIHAPQAGIVLRPPPRAEPEQEELARWTGAAFDAENLHATPEAGDLLCLVASAPLEGVILLSESDSGLARVGDEVRIALDRTPGEFLTGKVKAIGLTTAEDRRSRPTDSADVAVEQSLRGALEQDSAYRVSVSLDADQTTQVAQHGAVGQARIVTGRETVANWIGRWLRRLIRLDLPES